MFLKNIIKQTNKISLYLDKLFSLQLLTLRKIFGELHTYLTPRSGMEALLGIVVVSIIVLAFLKKKNCGDELMSNKQGNLEVKEKKKKVLTSIRERFKIHYAC